jgi:hypothetical protein
VWNNFEAGYSGSYIALSAKIPEEVCSILPLLQGGAKSESQWEDQEEVHDPEE